MPILTLYCPFCPEKKQITFCSDEWHCDDLDEERYALCPAHALLNKWRKTQCAGCVGGWVECDLFQSFQSSTKKPITFGELRTIEKGFCPRRTNGSFVVDRTLDWRKIKKIDYSSRAPVEVGKLLATSIKSYIEKFHPKK